MQKLIGNKATIFAKGIQNSTLTIDGSVDGEIFYSLKEAETVIEAWRWHYNTIRPHSSLGYQPPAPEALVMPAATVMAQTT